MGQRPFIILGDQTDHGGVVIEASVMTDTHGKGIARVGDQVTCPKRGHGTTVIVSGDPTMIIDGKPAARHGDKTACGATLISGQFVSTVGDGVGGGGAPGSRANWGDSTGGEPSVAVAGSPKQAHTYDHRFVLTCELTGVPLARQPYRLQYRGTTIDGLTNDEGMTDVITTGLNANEVTCQILGDASHG
jgi:uncharacterized Zn-binding protein involved in type VI secretion